MMIYMHTVENKGVIKTVKEYTQFELLKPMVRKKRSLLKILEEYKKTETNKTSLRLINKKIKELKRYIRWFEAQPVDL